MPAEKRPMVEVQPGSDGTLTVILNGHAFGYYKWSAEDARAIANAVIDTIGRRAQGPYREEPSK